MSWGRVKRRNLTYISVLTDFISINPSALCVGFSLLLELVWTQGLMVSGRGKS